MRNGKIRSLENALFSEWKGSLASFIYDGLVDEDAYQARDIKVIFALKESYDNTSSSDAVIWDLRLKLLDAKGPTWSTVARWAYGIGALPTGADWSATRDALKNPAVWSETMRSIGSMNIKKTPSRTAITDARCLSAYTEDSENSHFLYRQWSLYQPEITVCGGTEPFKRMVAALGGTPGQYQTTRSGSRYWIAGDGQFLIEACHPAARHAAERKYWRIIAAAQELLLT